MKRINIYLLVLTAFAVTTLGSCTEELELDEYTLLLVEKQAKLDRLDQLYDLSFDDPAEAQTEYDRFVEEELITEDYNFLTDQDILISSNYVRSAIQLNSRFLINVLNLPKHSLFELYDMKFNSLIINQGLFGDIPQQLKSGERYERFKRKVDEIDAFFDDQIKEFRENSTVDTRITGKKWFLEKYYFHWAYWKSYNIKFDFTLNGDKSANFDSFFFTPMIRYIDIDESKLTELKSNLLSAEEYAVYGNKIFFYFYLKDNIDHVNNTGRIARHWYFEYTYRVENNQLILSEPRKRLYLAPWLYADNFDDKNFNDFYPNELQEFVLVSNP
ncbi:MAG: hypothetical protein AB2L24_17570 [Mangrovibacterium sp.]